MLPAHAATTEIEATTTPTFCPADISCNIDNEYTDGTGYDLDVEVSATSVCGQDLTGAVALVTVIDERDPREICNVGPHEVVLDGNGEGKQFFPNSCFNYTGRVTASVEFKDKTTYGPNTGECSEELPA